MSVLTRGRSAAKRGFMVVIVLSLGTSAFGAEFAGGTGEPADPYQIATADQLVSIDMDPNLLDRHYVLTADIELAGMAFTGPVIGEFSGTFDGAGHVIRHLTVAAEDKATLFEVIEKDGVIMDLGVVEANVEGTGYHAALITAANRGTLSGCFSSGRVTGRMHVGGLAGFSQGTLVNCHSSAEVTGDTYVGGLVGMSTSVTFSACYATGPVRGTKTVGGLIGNNAGAILNCWSSGAVVGEETVGGLVGQNQPGSVQHCYSTGHVTRPTSGGGLVGDGEGHVTGSFWDMQTSGQAASAGGVGLTTAEMTAAQAYLDAGWDLLDESANGTVETWQMPRDGGYPVLSVFAGYTPPALAGTGTPDDPYLIATAADLGAIAWYDPGACYQLTTDIDLAGMSWPTAVVPFFRGVFDGNGKLIRNLTITGERHLGLFGRVQKGARIHDLGLVDARITGFDHVAGALAGAQAGTLTNCHSTGVVAGKYTVGGLVGQNNGDMIDCHTHGTVTSEGAIVGALAGYSNGSVLFCSSTSDVTATGNNVGGLLGEAKGQIIYSYSTGQVRSGGRWVGGLIGRNEAVYTASCYSTGAVYGTKCVGGLASDNSGIVINCYSTGPVTGTDHVGGLIAMNRTNVSRCYSTGAVTGTGSNVGGLVGESNRSMVDSFWDIETSGLDTSDGGIGLTTAQMCDVRTYQEAGWDLLGRREEGLCENWQMPPDGGYPLLSFFNGYRPIPPDGHGTAEAPYLLQTVEDFCFVAWYPLDHYRLVGDIDLTAIAWSGPVIPWFGGSLAGDGYAVRNLTISGDHSLGLFGMVGRGASVADLGVLDANVVGPGNYVGALAAVNGGNIVSCYSSGHVTGRDYTGGLIGAGAEAQITSSSSIIDCNSAATVSGRVTVGGLIGWSRGHCDMIRCHSAATVYATASSSGGLVGSNSGRVTDCDSHAEVHATAFAGGLIGANNSSVANCSSAATVGGERWVGGLLGKNSGSLSGCTNDSAVTGGVYTGGLLAQNRGTVRDCHNTGPVYGERYVGGLVGENTDAGKLYDSTSTGDVSGTGIQYGGLVGINFGLTTGCSSSGAVTGTNVLGGLMGENRGTLKTSYSTGSVTGETGVGGLVGENRGTVSACYSTGATTGGGNVGGLAGDNAGSIANCYSQGAVTGRGGWIGGLAGWGAGTVSKCYSTGHVIGGPSAGGLADMESPGTITGCFWDKSTSGLRTSGGGTGLWTSEMQSRWTFLMAGWQFDSVWTICDGMDYPRLSWEDADCGAVLEAPTDRPARRR